MRVSTTPKDGPYRGCLAGSLVTARIWLCPGTVWVPGHNVLRVLWRCPTLPHPPRCSTIGACGLSFQVRNGCWAFPRGYDHHKLVQPYSLEGPPLLPAGFGGWGVVLVVIRIVATSILWMSVNRLWLMCVFSVGPLVPVGSRAPRGASTSGLSTR